MSTPARKAKNLVRMITLSLKALGRKARLESGSRVPPEMPNRMKVTFGWAAKFTQELVNGLLPADDPKRESQDKY